MDSAWIIKIVNSFINLFFIASCGCFIGTIIEQRNWSRFVAFIAKPIVRFGRLPDICASSFITSFASAHASNNMLVSAYDAKQISRAQMIIGGIANTFPRKLFMNVKIINFIPVFPILMVAYLLIQLCVGFTRTFLLLLINRFYFSRKEKEMDNEKLNEMISEKLKAVPTWKATISIAKKRTLRFMKKMLIITMPIYFVVLYLSKTGIIKKIEKLIPDSLDFILTPEIIDIMLTRFASLIVAIRHSSEMLSNSQVSITQILIALLAGNIITTPFRTVRRNLPIALAIFPNRDGIWVVCLTQGYRMLASFLLIIVLLLIQAG